MPLHRIPIQGNKWFTTGLVNNCNKLACCNDKLYCTERDCEYKLKGKLNDCYKPKPRCKPKPCQMWY